MKRKTYLDYLRVFAAFAVIMIHVSYQNMHLTELGDANWYIFKTYLMASNWAVPVFCMISGSLFLARDIDVKTMITKYIFRIAIVFVGWSLFYTLVFELKNGWLTAAGSFVRGYSHMWFLYMIAGLYLVTPILRLVAKDQKLLKYFIILGFITSILIPEVLELVGIISPRANAYMSKAYSYVETNVVSGYVVYYMLGYYLDNLEINKRRIMRVAFIGAICFIGPVIVFMLCASLFGVGLPFLFGNFSAGDFIRSTTIFLLAKYLAHGKDGETKELPILHFISRHTFTLYLVHQFVITMLNRLFGLNTLSFSAALSVPIIGIMSFIISVFLAVILDVIWDRTLPLIIKRK